MTHARRIRQQLAQMGIAENTLIIYMSDNGAPLRAGAYNRIAEFPEIADRLEKMLLDQADRWHFKGLPEGHPLRPDQYFYDQHVEQSLPPLPLGEGLSGTYIPWVEGVRRPDLRNTNPLEFLRQTGRDRQGNPLN